MWPRLAPLADPESPAVRAARQRLAALIRSTHRDLCIRLGVSQVQPEVLQAAVLQRLAFDSPCPLSQPDQLLAFGGVVSFLYLPELYLQAKETA